MGVDPPRKVEDDADSADSLALLLRWLGHEAQVAGNGEIALAAAPELQPDVMLIDLTMPGIGGCQLAKRLRRQTDFAKTPLAAVSGYMDGPRRNQAVEAGFDDFRGKPYTADELAALFGRLKASVAFGWQLAAAARPRRGFSRDVVKGGERPASGAGRPSSLLSRAPTAELETGLASNPVYS